MILIDLYNYTIHHAVVLFLVTKIRFQNMRFISLIHSASQILTFHTQINSKSVQKVKRLKTSDRLQAFGTALGINELR